MRRVSSRQRLVSWDAFDASAPEGEDSNLSDSGGEEEGVNSSNVSLDGYDTPTEDDIGIVSNGSQDMTTAVGRKRDRSTRRAEHKGFIASPLVAKTVSSPMPVLTTPNDRDAVQMPPPTSLHLSSLAVPALIPNDTWDLDGDLSFHDHLKNSASTNTLSSFVTTCTSSTSTMLPSPPACTSPRTGPLHFNQLMNDVHTDIFAFLDIESLQSIMSVNKQYRRLVLSQDGHLSLWKHHCQNAWKVGGQQVKDGNSLPVMYLDRFHLPTAAAGFAPHTTNIPLLLRMTPTSYPTGVDEDLVNAQNLRTERLRPLQTDHEIPAMRLVSIQQREEQSQIGHLRSYHHPRTGRKLVQYTGPIGAGDRCIRSDHPLPRPKRDEQQDQEQQSKGRFLVNLLRRGANKMMSPNTLAPNNNNCASSTSTQQRKQWKPFVVPFMENSSTVNVTPRLISYYEVSILPLELESTEDENDDSIVGPTAAGPRPGQRTDCVAVGLATDSFHVHTRMPGWDRQSFGYHSDDGGIFHSSGAMVKQFGPKFGAGDTVGCGIDFVNQGIFFTLNGRFLGYGWSGIDEGLFRNNLYPVVGLDTNCPLHLNFGADEPFQFDLSQFIMKHEGIISPQYIWEDRCPSLVSSSTTTSGVKLTRELSLRSFPSASSLASISSTSSSVGRRRRRRRGAGATRSN